MGDEPTCGKGLAEHSVIPAKLAELTALMAENLEVHMKSLDREDANAEREYRVYLKLAQEHREIADRLAAIAEEMAGSRELPMGRHDEEALSSAAIAEAFDRFVTVKQELVALLEQQLEQDRQLLSAMC
jgi:hypothetical protein